MYHHFRNIRRTAANTVGLYSQEYSRLLQLDNATANIQKIMGGSVTTGDDLIIYPNVTDGLPNIRLYGAGTLDLISTDYVRCWSGANSAPMFWRSGTTGYMGGSGTSGNNFELQVNTGDINGDIYLRTGTGVLKFGTHTGSGDAASNGYITIKDAAGNTRKLMTTA